MLLSDGDATMPLPSVRTHAQPVPTNSMQAPDAPGVSTLSTPVKKAKLALKTKETMSTIGEDIACDDSGASGAEPVMHIEKTHSNTPHTKETEQQVAPDPDTVEATNKASMHA